MSNIASVGHFEPTTRAMGPGLRACLWVRGCPIRCPRCATPEFIPIPEGHPYSAVIARPEPKQSRGRARMVEIATPSHRLGLAMTQK